MTAPHARGALPPSPTGAAARRHRGHRRLLTTTWVATLVAQGVATAAASPASAAAQSPTSAARSAPARDDGEGGGHRVPRRLLFALVGVGAGIAIGAAYRSGHPTPGTCSSPSCVTVVASGAGAFVGYLVGREFDEVHRVRYRAGAPLAPRVTSTLLVGGASALAARDSLVAVATPRGVDLFVSAPAALRVAGRRAAGVRGVAALELLAPSNAIALAASSGAYFFPPERGAGVLLRPGPAAAVAAAGGERLFVATGTRVEVATVTAAANTTPADSAARVASGVDLGRPVTALAWDAARSVLWAGTDSTLVALRTDGDSLTRLAVVPLGAAERRIALDGPTVAVALGESGVRVLDARDPAAPAERARWTAARFAYDLALAAGRLFVAAGDEGLYVLDPAAAGARLVVGVTRDVGTAVAVVAHGSEVFVVDRAAPALRRIPARF